MKHIAQNFDSGDCGVACIAMVTATPYDRVMLSVPPDVADYGLWIPEVLHCLKKITGTEWTLKLFTTDFPQLSRFEFPLEPAIVGVLRIEHGNVFHYVASDGEYLYDPLLPDRILITDAQLDYHSGWLVNCVIKRI